MVKPSPLNITAYEKGFSAILRHQQGGESSRHDRQQMWLKIGGLVVLAILFFWFANRGRAGRAQAQFDKPEPTAIAGNPPIAIPTATLPPITIGEFSLQTIGGLGGALTIGRPSAIELHYQQTEEIVALPIDPSQTTNRGELRYSELVMRSDSPVAVWLFGTVLNYGIGIPDNLVRQLQPEDRIILTTDTGATLRFIVASRQQLPNYSATQQLSQNKIGMSLFALPATAPDDVSIAFARYDATEEGQPTQPVHELNETFQLTDVTCQITEATFSYNERGDSQLQLRGSWGGTTPLFISLSTPTQQTTATPIQPDETGKWAHLFPLSQIGPLSKIGGTETVYAELRTTTNELGVVRLGEVPVRLATLHIQPQEAGWGGGKVVIHFQVENAGRQNTVLLAEDIQIEGGDAYKSDPILPMRMPAGSVTEWQLWLTPDPQAEQIVIQVGTERWEVDTSDK